jgi:hypothetical protein
VLEWSSGWEFFLFFSFYAFSCILVLLISWKLVFWCSRWSNSICQSDLKDGHSWSLSVPMPVTWWCSASPPEGSCWDDLGSVYSMVGLGWFHISLDTREGVAFFLGFVHSQDSTLAYSPVGCYAAKWDQLLMSIFCFTTILLHLIYSWNICDIQVIRSEPCSKEFH